MGIYERDYVRNRPPPRGFGGSGFGSPRGWSVNTWIIVACIAVFMVDNLMPPSVVSMQVELLPGVADNVLDAGQVVEGDIGVVQRQLKAPLVLLPENKLVGYHVYMQMRPLTEWLHFSTERGFLGFQLWRLVGFQFLHYSVSHILFNMIGLYFFGPIVERYLGSKRYVAFYLLSGICGALMYLLLNLGGITLTELGDAETVARVPFLLGNSGFTPLVGASAGVFGVLMAGAFLAPNATVLLFFIIPMPLKVFAYALVVLALYTVMVSGHNAGGEAGHLGGAIAGWYFIRHPRHLHNFFDVVGWLDPTSHHYRGERSRFRNQAIAKLNRPKRGPSRTEIDRVLDKVHQEGLGSLSEKEKRILREASEKGS